METIKEAIENRVLLIAEIGINHNGDEETAMALLEAAAQSGADAVKWQLFDADQMVSRWAPGVSHADSQGMLALFRSLQLPETCWAGLRRRARELGVHFGCSLFDFKALGWARQLDLDFLKIASGELTNRPLLEASFPLCESWIISTGASTTAEIAALVEWLSEKGRPDPVLLECTSAYPAKAEQIRLGNIPWLRDTFSVTSGFSDHSLGAHLAVAAVAMGARVIEKHFTLDRLMSGPDHALSMDPAGFKEMTAAIRDAESALSGSGKPQVMPWETEARLKGRKSVVAARPLPAGTRLELAHLVLKRPGDGISPLHYEELPGRVLRESVLEDQPLQWSMLE
jgi:sialic acid synthase SpsE